MKVKFFGTGAWEGIPSMFCKCPVCEYARRVKGKEVRSRSGFMVDGKIALDFSPDAYQNFVKNDVVFGEIERLFITHSHEDHLYPSDVLMCITKRESAGLAPLLHVYGNDKVIDMLTSNSLYLEETKTKANFHPIRHGDVVQFDGYEVTALYTYHDPSEESFAYLIAKGEKAYLHLVDSDEPQEKLLNYLVEKGIKLDGVSADCTSGSLEQGFGGHMSIWQNIRTRDALKKLHLLQKNAKYILTHVSHFSGVDTHEFLSKIAAENDMILAYDGMEIDL